MLISNRPFIWQLYDKAIQSVSTYVLRAAKRRTCIKFHQDSLKTKRLVCIETDEQTDKHMDMAISTKLVALIKNIYIVLLLRGSVRPPSMRYSFRDKIIIPSARV